jgi:hypothetical protein
VAGRHYFSVSSAIERVTFTWTVNDKASSWPQGFLEARGIPKEHSSRVRQLRDEGKSPKNALGLSIIRGPQKSFFSLPHLWLAVLVVFVAALPWLRWRFGLLTLLIATTLVAIILGAAVIAAR